MPRLCFPIRASSICVFTSQIVCTVNCLFFSVQNILSVTFPVPVHHSPSISVCLIFCSQRLWYQTARCCHLYLLLRRLPPVASIVSALFGSIDRSACSKMLVFNSSLSSLVNCSKIPKNSRQQIVVIQLEIIKLQPQQNGAAWTNASAALSRPPPAPSTPPLSASHP